MQFIVLFLVFFAKNRAFLIRNQKGSCTGNRVCSRYLCIPAGPAYLQGVAKILDAFTSVFLVQQIVLQFVLRGCLLRAKDRALFSFLGAFGVVSLQLGP